MNTVKRTALWERLDEPGWESAARDRIGALWEIDARFVGIHEGHAVAADYRLVVDQHWVTVRFEANWGLGPARSSLTLDRVGTRWRVDGEPRPDLDGCIDVDVGWSPLTNTLPIRRLALPENQPHEIHVAWIHPGTLEVTNALQRYTRTGPRGVRFESLQTGFTADLELDEEDLVVQYPGLFRRLA